ncbi:MAG: 2-phosphosulfolactate phosphatase, partial [Burkholderiales bacterium]|nr:2-phosphosulfolactate phosphatase [Phycisphaerae bacterium]
MPSARMLTARMVPVRVILVPGMLDADKCIDHAVVVFDVLRATTTMAAALDAGAVAIRVFASLDACRQAAREFAGPKLTLGEKDCLPPADFDLGNSPGDCDVARCGGKTLFMSTSNGTRALLAARAARVL